jgi:hypothetical protein
MKKGPGGFYANSLEMLLDTMCNMLGGIVFIALMVALVAQDSPPPPPDYYQAQAAQLSNDLAAITVSNSMVEAELQKTLRYQQTIMAGDHFLRKALSVGRAFDGWTGRAVAQ